MCALVCNVKEREERRKKFAEEQLVRQFREGCDDLRLIDGQKFSVHCADQQRSQMDDHVEAKKNERVEDAKWAKVYHDESKKKEKREIDELDGTRTALCCTASSPC